MHAPRPLRQRILFHAMALAIGLSMLVFALIAGLAPVVTFADARDRQTALWSAPICAVVLLLLGLGLRRLGLRGFPVDDAIGGGLLLVLWNAVLWWDANVQRLF